MQSRLTKSTRLQSGTGLSIELLHLELVDFHQIATMSQAKGTINLVQVEKNTESIMIVNMVCNQVLTSVNKFKHFEIRTWEYCDTGNCYSTLLLICINFLTNVAD